MFKTAQELQQFIIWCKSQKVKAFKHDQVQFELSDLAFVTDYDEPAKVEKDLSFHDSKTLTETDKESDAEDEDLLFWSSN